MIGKLLRKLILRNWGLKLFSLFLSILLWLVLVPEEKISNERTLSLQLDLYSRPEHLELVEKDISTVDVTLRAPRRLMEQIGPANVFARLNLEKASVIQEEYPLNASNISAPSGARVIRVHPNKVRLRFEPAKELELVVEPTLVGQPPRGFRLEKVEVSPPRVPVRGPESKVREQDKVFTTPIDISNLTQSTDIRADLILPRPETRVPTQRTFVRVRLIIVESDGSEAAGGNPR
ncbi:MAG: YbbR-like domain-containing protein [Candidatus Aminicenantes bacterium]|nr:YbbR-like domain-containing protein [Candidatus Aminicenantes bacterium]